MSDSEGRVASPETDGALNGTDREILEFAACHSMVLYSQVVTFLGRVKAQPAERIARLEAKGLIRSAPRLRYQRGAFQVTAAGLREIGSGLPVPMMDLRGYWRSVGVAWLWVGARRGMFGPVERIYTEREMRVADERSAAQLSAARGLSPAVRAKAAAGSFGLTVAGEAGPVVHYPDVVVVEAPGRVAMELIWDRPSAAWLGALLEAYAAKPSVQLSVFFFVDAVVGERLRAARAARGWDERVMRVEKVGLQMDAE